MGEDGDYLGKSEKNGQIEPFSTNRVVDFYFPPSKTEFKRLGGKGFIVEHTASRRPEGSYIPILSISDRDEGHQHGQDAGRFCFSASGD